MTGTTLPRWTREPAAGHGHHEAAVPGEVATALERLADELGVPESSLLLAAHAKVLSVLSGDAEVVTGYCPTPDSSPLPCRVAVEPGSWRALVGDAHRRLGHRDPEPGDSGREHPAGLALSVGMRRRGGLTLVLRYRRDVLDAASAERIAGYHRTALGLLVADPDSDHARHSLLSSEETRLQLDGLAGPSRPLPDRRAHELFEERVRAHPGRVAAIHGGQEWTYAQLNDRANRLARVLLTCGLGREGVVAVVTERNLDWMAAVLAVFKAGGAYLPIEPHFPADRIARTISQAGCTLALTERGSTATLDRAVDGLPGVHTLFIDAAYEEARSGADLGLEVTPEQLAYIYFTSGSTGQPKGAMCEHAGMLNHLFAKIDDLAIGEGSVVAQTAPQCFDISLWQLVSALLVGGRTLIVEQAAILDVERFMDTIVRGRVAVLQVVPSYLEALLTYLESRPHELAALRCVSVTGEALKKELAQRWFALEPHIKLANAYGLTETSDDTNHEVMDRAPDGDRVPLGRPVNNVHVYVVDEQLAPVPLGAPGEIVFSGVCVGRGYVNDPERTRAAFMADPHRPGRRLYRSGDYGRWRPDGKLEFLGRRDSQVKIRGFRIEIGEIENTLLRLPGVRDGAVVVTGRSDETRQLVAFYTGQQLAADRLRDGLGASLPSYLIPSAFHWRESLPLTANSKIDKKQLRTLASELDAVAPAQEAPNTATEHRLAAAWAKVLGIPQGEVRRGDHFFDRGGTSLSAVKLAIALDRAVSIKDITGQPVLADLAALMDGRSERHSGLLQPLLEPDDVDGVVICFPYAGGNGVNFQPLAAALRGARLGVYAVELPGHDLTAQRQPFATTTQVVEAVVDEIAGRGFEQILLWGHSSGTPLALETARTLEQRGVQVTRVFLGAQLLGDAHLRREAITELGTRSDVEIAQSLSMAGGYTELGELDAERAERVGAAYRHDFLSANRYLADAIGAPPTPKLCAPVTVVVAADDPSTTGFAQRYSDWELVAEHVELCELTAGGHYFLRTSPAAAAQAVLDAVRSPAGA